MDIRKIERDFSEMSRIQQMAYAANFRGTKEEIEELCNIFKDLTGDDDIVALGAYDRDLMGCVLHYDFKTNFHGEMIHTAGIGSLAVDLIHKKKRVARSLIEASLNKAREEGVDLYYLYPFSTKFYRNFGFGYGSPMYTYCVRPEDFIDDGDRGLLSYGTADDYEDVFSFYDNYAKKHNGMSLKTYGDRRRIEKMKIGRLIVAKDQGELIGYMVFSQKGIDEKDDQAQKILVHEMVYTPKALKAFSSFFNAQKDQVNYIQLATHDVNFHHVLNDTCFASEPRTQEIISLKVSDKALGLMPLALNPQNLLNRLEKPSKCLKFNITHRMKETELAVLGEGEEINMTLTINDFSSWITGAISLNELYRLGNLETDQRDLLKSIDRHFYFERPKSLTRY